MKAPELDTVAVDTVVAEERTGTAERRSRAGWGLGPAFWLAVGWLSLMAFVAVFADILPFQDPLAPDPTQAHEGPGIGHWFGTDSLGRDMLARVAHGAQVSLTVAVTSASVACIVGGSLGLVAGYFGGRRETWIMAVMDAILAFPSLVLALALTAFLGPSLRNTIVAIGLLAIPVFARIGRAQTLSYKKREFVLAAEAMGAKHGRILRREVAPNVAPSLVTFALVAAALAILVEGSLSYLGAGVPPPAPTWGGIIAAGQGDLARAPHASLIPAAVMFLTVVSLNTAGERLRVRYDSAGGGHA
jgi:peptide/nickel transport system permease protein